MKGAGTQSAWVCRAALLTAVPGLAAEVGEKPPSNLLEFVAQQIDADPDEFGDYAAREQTRQEHPWILAKEYG